MDDLVARALAGEKLAVARLISVFEDTRAEVARERARLLAELAAHSDRDALIVGITGTPGSGKSSLLGELATRLIAADPALTVGVLAVDPSSHVSGGALLGDRTRVRFPPGERRLFFRSQASDRDLGGVGRSTFQVCRAARFLFDVLFVETVGIGQSEVEIQQVADWTYLVIQPMAGDQVQFMKAGIMEVPDAFVVNKCDQVEAAERAFHALDASLRMARLGAGRPPIIHKTSAVSGAGLDELVTEIRNHSAPNSGQRRPMALKEAYFFGKWVRDEYGRNGLRALRDPAATWLAREGGFEAAQLAFARRMPDLVESGEAE